MESYRWLNFAAAAGIEGAAQVRDVLVTRMSPGQREAIRAEPVPR